MEQNAIGSKRIIEELFGAGKYELADELIAAGAVGHDPALPESPVGPEGVKESARGYRTAFPDLTITVDQVIAEGEYVATRWTARGAVRDRRDGQAVHGHRDFDRPLAERKDRRVLGELGHARHVAAARRGADCHADGLSFAR
jgi:SnoaL-like polyketide cyclase